MPDVKNSKFTDTQESKNSFLSRDLKIQYEPQKCQTLEIHYWLISQSEKDHCSVLTDILDFGNSQLLDTAEFKNSVLIDTPRF